MLGIKESMVGMADYGRDSKVPIVKKFGKCHYRVCAGC